MRATLLTNHLITTTLTLIVSVTFAQDDLDIDALFEDLDISVTEEAVPAPEPEPAREQMDEELDLDALFEETPEPDEPEATPGVSADEPEATQDASEGGEPEAVPEGLVTDMEVGPVDESMMAVEADAVDSSENEMAEEAVKEVDPAQAMARELSLAEELKRQAQEIEGLSQLESGYDLLKQEKYDEALKAFNSALVKLPVRPANEAAIQRAKFGRIEANYRLAVSAFDRSLLTEARRYTETTLGFDPQHRGANRLLSKITRELNRPVIEPPLRKRDDFIAKQDQLETLYQDGIEYFEVGHYKTAENFFERALLLDPYHISSMRYLKKIHERLYDVHSRTLETTRADMIQQVRETWSPPIKGDLAIPDEIQNRSVQTTVSAAAVLEEKMQNIIIPSIEFRQANIQDVVSFLVEASEIGDPDGEGVNIILNLNKPGQTSSTPSANTGGGFNAPDTGGGFDFGGFDDFGAEPAAQQPAFDQSTSDVPSITLNLRRVRLLDAIRYITEVANLKFRIEANAVIITPADVPSGRVITRVYPVLPSFLDVVVDRTQTDQQNDRTGEFIEMGGGETTISRGNVKDFFIGAGIPFPTGTSVTYNPAISSLIVANTQENIELFERLLPQFNVVPNQVEIEARFVEVAQDDLEQLGFEWIITDDVEIAERAGPGPAATKERVQINADPEGFSKGLRFFGLGSAGIETSSAGASGGSTSLLGDLLSFSGILTNPELTVVLHALDQNGNVDVLSAPRVTTRSGVQASMEVVQEIIYPTEFDTEIGTLTTQIGDGGGTLEQDLVAITPGSFETRETGVILNVTPTVGPDGYTIELVMAPEVADLVDWIDYGTGVTRIPQPVFESRNVTTSIVVWDGQTVVMGGLITEQLTTIHDKIPILGDIPFIGRLFRNEGEASSKRNLLIFVTARVVDPAGNPIRQAESVGVQAGGGAQEALTTP